MYDLQMRESIEARLNVLRIFRQLGPSMPANQIVFFLNAAKYEGLCVTDIANASKVTKTTASRYIKFLTESGGKDQPGLGLLYSYDNPKNKRERLVVLTNKGHALLKRIAAVSS